MTPDLPQVEITITEMTNAFRRQNRLSALKRNRTLDQAARAFAGYLARTGKFSHTADGRQPADRTARVGYKHCYISENLALNIDSRGFAARQLARGAIDGWKKSPSHRRAMIDPIVTEIGVGVVKAAGEHRYLSVQLFGRPKALQYRFTIRNKAARRVGYSHTGQDHELPPRTQVQYTQCKPAKLRFERIIKAKRRANAIAEFAPRDGDLFVIRTDRPGNLIVEHFPRAN